jgi:hypothetical protein
MLGENYRKEWSQPVAMKMFDVTKEKGFRFSAWVEVNKQNR